MIAKGNRLTEQALFLYKFLKAPKQVGSVAPSSAYLAQRMFELIDWGQTRSIVELGAGTGAFTRYIHQYKPANCKAIIVEQDEQMRNRLKRKYPQFQYSDRAEALSGKLKQFDLEGVDCILSGLPFANFDPQLREQILDEVTRCLKPGGQFIAFQYSLQMKRYLSRYFTQVDVKFVPLNFPPAFVYHCNGKIEKGE